MTPEPIEDRIELTAQDQLFIHLCREKRQVADAYHRGQEEAITSLQKAYLSSLVPQDGSYSLNREGTALVRTKQEKE
jgi:hypothetical protein